MNYDRLVIEAMRGVVREALARVAREGRVGGHHFLISFLTSHPGAQLADHLRAENPEEMTIVLENQFWGLEVDEEAFAVTLSFKGVNQRLRVPFAAVTAFADPSVQFGLQFTARAKAAVAGDADKDRDQARSEAKVGAEVVTLDSFREKK